MKAAATAALVAGLMVSPTAAHAHGQSDLAPARRATASFHRLANAEAAGYESTIDTLGCFENPGVGGMGLHYLRSDLLDDTLHAAAPEALVYEMRDDGKLELVAHEYIVPIDAWDGDEPPKLFGRAFHEHAVLPLYVLHAWVWAPNPAGMFEDWNPQIGDCPDGVPVFGG